MIRAVRVRMERKLTAILCADVHGYSRLMGENEEATVRTLSTHRKIIDALIEQHHGRFVNSAGDSVLAEFTSVVNALECAVEIQTKLRVENESLPPERRMEFRIGVNLGDVTSASSGLRTSPSRCGYSGCWRGHPRRPRSRFEEYRRNTCAAALSRWPVWR